ncbi:MAG: nucleoside 2-deoxyribosyltransferase [Burkholderiales bacterium]
MHLYLAGFDVFRSDARDQGERLKALCAAFGHEGLFPLDNDLPTGLQGPAAARWIFEANIALIRRADAVLANLNDFRGHEPDSGTAFEVGYAAALGKPVWAYLGDGRPLRQQLGGATDAQGFSVEDFGLPRNLMLACAATLVMGDAAAALAAMAGQAG